MDGWMGGWMDGWVKVMFIVSCLSPSCPGGHCTVRVCRAGGAVEQSSVVQRRRPAGPAEQGAPDAASVPAAAAARGDGRGHGREGQTSGGKQSGFF